MKVCIVTPAPRGSHTGNRVTALRWAVMLRSLGHRVTLVTAYDGRPCDLLVALHARKSFDSVMRYRACDERAPLIVALTGTDVYGDLGRSPETQRSIEVASLLVVLQPLAIAELPEALRPKARVIRQSVPTPSERPEPPVDRFEVCVLAHLRDVKDPLRAARAARLLPPSSRVRITHLGGAQSEPLREAALAEERDNPRYRWLGDVPRRRALGHLGRSHLLVLTSIMEGGANVVSEAVACGVPVVSSAIPGSIGLLGEHYPGFFPVGDTAALAALLRRAEEEPTFYAELRRRCAEIAPLIEPARERRAWEAILGEL
jgi:putative glycosyltransferase (TIGR04348 family)